MRRRQKVALTSIVVLALVFFIFVPFVRASTPGPYQFPCYYAGTCKPSEVYFTVSLSCYLLGESPNTWLGAYYWGPGFSMGCLPVVT
jgi:hypothetical protein